MNSIGIPYAMATIHPETGEPGELCPVCGEFCPRRVDAEGETVLYTYGDHYVREHESDR